MADFKKILIANRGEIAIRIMRAANEMGKKTVAVLQRKTNWGCIGLRPTKPIALAKAWALLQPISRLMKSFAWLVNAARMRSTQVTAYCPKIPRFVDACDKNGITFIGPKAETMRALGDKASARKWPLRQVFPSFPRPKYWAMIWTRLPKRP